MREIGKKSRKSVKRRKPVIPQSSVKKRKLERVPPEAMEVPPPSEERIAESILGDRWNANHGEHEFLVKWKRRNLSEASWVNFQRIDLNIFMLLYRHS